MMGISAAKCLRKMTIKLIFTAYTLVKEMCEVFLKNFSILKNFKKKCFLNNLALRK